MNGEIICVGTELLLGDIVNTNAQFLSKELAGLGINVYSQAVVGDNMKRLKKQLSLSLARSELVLLTGGLGPTEDDLTKEAVAEALGLKLVPHEESLQKIKDYFDRIGRPMTESNKKQALCPEGALIMPNDNGTAPGYIIKSGSQVIMLFPGPPSELNPMFLNYGVPFLKKLSGTTIVSHNVNIFGVGEALVAELLGNLLDGSNPTVATYAKTGETLVRVTARSGDSMSADELTMGAMGKVIKLFGDNVYGIDAESLQSVVVEQLIAQNKKIATAESCTAGMLSSRITEIPGSSAVFDMGVTAYANYIKIQALGVKESTIQQFGAVSSDVAAEMAVSIRSLCGCDLGIGITGIAGPDDSENKPAGLVYIAVADTHKVFVRKIMCGGNDREKTRITATSTALDMARRYLSGSEEFLAAGTPIGAALNVMEGYPLPQTKPTEKIVPRMEEPVNKEDILKDISFAAPVSAAAMSDEDLFKLINTSLDEELPEGEKPEKMDIETEGMDFIYISEEDETFKPDAEEEPMNIKEKGFIGFLKGILPWKGDPVFEKVRKVIFLTSLIAVIGLVSYIAVYFSTGFFENKAIDKIKTVWDAPDSNKKNADGIFIGFEDLIKQNSDIKAWLTIPNTNIDNPVYQAKNNDYYVTHNMNKQESRYGALFIDKDAKITADTVSQNIVVYGHHMNDGSMFGNLKSYLKLDFYKANPVINFKTLYRDGQYKVFAVFITNTKKQDDNDYIFNYRHASFSSQTNFLSWVDEVKSRSIIDTGVDVIDDDELITLSTCTYEFKDARLVVMARRVRDGETGILDTANSKLNSNPHYPQIWYDQKGIKRPATSSTQATSNVITSVTSSVTTSVTTSSEISSKPTTTSTKTTTSNKSSSTNTSSVTSSKQNSSSSSTVPANTTASDNTSSAPPSSSESSTTPVD